MEGARAGRLWDALFGAAFVVLVVIACCSCGADAEKLDPCPASDGCCFDCEEVALAASEARACDPVSNLGCAPTEKCTFLFDARRSFPARAGCAPDGWAGFGQACSSGEATGTDNCAGGLLCREGVCTEICTDAPDTCPAEFYCEDAGGHFGDAHTGLCEPACALFGEDCSEGERCYLLLPGERHQTLCAPPVPEPPPSAGGCGVPGASEPGTQGDCCSYVNTCARGFGCVLPAHPGAPPGELVCALFCDPSGTVGEAPRGCDPPGPGPAPAWQCVPLSGLYGDLPALPDSLGVCIDTAVWRPERVIPAQWKARNGK